MLAKYDKVATYLDGILPVSPSLAFWCKRGQCLSGTWHNIIWHICLTPCQPLFLNNTHVTDLWLNRNKLLFSPKKLQDAKFSSSS